MKEYYFIALIIKVIDFVFGERETILILRGGSTISIKLINYEFRDFEIEKTS